MMTITSDTKIGTILKLHPGALEAIISISPRFEKLRNPLLRKLMAGRTSIAMASKIAGCSPFDFFSKLRPLGFEPGKEAEQKPTSSRPLPFEIRNIEPAMLVQLDVRPDLAAGGDPLQRILGAVKQLKKGQVMVIINTFEPVPLMQLLKKRGYESHTVQISPDTFHSYFHRVGEIQEKAPAEQNVSDEGWDELMQRYKDNLLTIDVRQLEMPGPMMTILETLDKMPEGKALFVYHKRIPVFLLPELADRKLEFRAREIREGEVHLLIFKP